MAHLAFFIRLPVLLIISQTLDISAHGQVTTTDVPKSMSTEARQPLENWHSITPVINVLVGPSSQSDPWEQATIRDCQSCPELIRIPAGAFQIGSPNNEPGRIDHEGPQRQISVARFLIGRFEITVGQFKHFIDDQGYTTRDDGCYHRRDDGWQVDALRSWKNPGFDQTDDHPAICVSFLDIEAYLHWLVRKTGKAYRLPSEAEWEYVARTGKSSPLSLGDIKSNACAYLNGYDETGKERAALYIERLNCNDGFGYTAPIGSFEPNNFGIHDMIGNVSEWVADSYRSNYDNIPKNGTAWTKFRDRLRVIRGGSWISPPKALRPAWRDKGSISHRSYVHGFRVARSDE